MLALKKIGLALFILNLVGMVVLVSMLNEDSHTSYKDHSAFFAKEAQLTKEELLEENNLLKSELQELLKHQSNISQTLRESNPFYILGAYPEIGLDYVTPSYDTPNYGFKNDDDYCELVDSFNLAHQENIFELKNFFTDYVELSLVRVDVMKKVGRIYADGVERRMEANGTLELTNHFDHRITSFFLNNGKFHSYHKIGQHFLCATQIYNHIPGNSAATNKLKLVNHLHNYNAQYKNKRHCFNKDSFFPPTYRLQNKEECEEFFDIIQSKAYKELIKHEPIKYVIKSGKGVHKSDGVFLLDDEMTEKLNTDYDYGQNCGTEKQSFIAQTYIGNPLLLENDNKFDFRVFMLVASTNPLIVYYHDGFLRVSLNAYDKTSSDRATHLTNSAIANKLIKEAKQEGKSVVNNMTMEEIEESRSWDLEKLQEYLLEKNLIEDSNWLDNYLRPGFKKAFVHLTRMTHHAFWNQSNVYELQGVDFILDDKLKLWFIESNSSPFFNGKKRLEFFSTMLLDMFEIQYAYYRSRMQRIVKVISAMQKDTEGKNIEKWRKMYQEAARNRLESEYQISKNNSFSIVVDENLPGSKAYFGIISSECL